MAARLLLPASRGKGAAGQVLQALRRPEPPRFLRINYANGDMVGHTGDLGAAIKAAP